MRRRRSVPVATVALFALVLTPGCGGCGGDADTTAIDNIRSLGCTVSQSGSQVTVTCEDAYLTNEQLATLAANAKSFKAIVLSLEGTSVTGEGLRHLASLTNLTDLDLSGLTLSDGSIANLSGLSALVQLELKATGISDAALDHLRPLTSLERLVLDGNVKITGSGLKQVARLPKLRDLRLNGTEVTDEGIKHLQGMNSLEKLWLQGVETVSGETIEQLKASKAGLEVHR